jgi:hypothetical protein
MREILFKLDQDIKTKENLIVKLQWSKGEIRDVIFEKEKDIEGLK